MTRKQLEAGAIRYLDNWKTWMVVAYFGLAVVVVWLFFLNQRTAGEVAARQAQQKSANASQVSGCYASVRNAPALEGILDSIDLLAMNSIKSSEAALIADPGSPLAKVRRDSIERLHRARTGVAVFRDRMAQQTPTAAACDKLARRLGVDPAPYKEEK